VTHEKVSKIECFLKWSNLSVGIDQVFDILGKSRVTVVVELHWFLQNFLPKKNYV
jgi:hypothetical protein